MKNEKLNACYEEAKQLHAEAMRICAVLGQKEDEHTTRIVIIGALPTAGLAIYIWVTLPLLLAMISTIAVLAGWVYIVAVIATLTSQSLTEKIRAALAHQEDALKLMSELYYARSYPDVSSEGVEKLQKRYQTLKEALSNFEKSL